MEALDQDYKPCTNVSWLAQMSALASETIAYSENVGIYTGAGFLASLVADS